MVLLVPHADGSTLKKSVIFCVVSHLGGLKKTGPKSEDLLEIKCKASLINISEEVGQSLRRPEETMETTLNLVVSRASEDEVCICLYLL